MFRVMLANEVDVVDNLGSYFNATKDIIFYVSSINSL